MKADEYCVREAEQAPQSRQVRVRSEARSLTLEALSRCEVADHQRLASRVAHELDRRVDRLPVIARERHRQSLPTTFRRRLNRSRIYCAERTHQPRAG